MRRRNDRYSALCGCAVSGTNGKDHVRRDVTEASLIGRQVRVRHRGWLSAGPGQRQIAPLGGAVCKLSASVRRHDRWQEEPTSTIL